MNRKKRSKRCGCADRSGIDARQIDDPDAARRSRVLLASSTSKTSHSSFERARKWIARAERIAFLKFGFHAQNLHRLNAVELLKKLQSEFGIGDRLGSQLNEPVEAPHFFDQVEL
jgi:hypothetical protein